MSRGQHQAQLLLPDAVGGDAEMARVAVGHPQIEPPVQHPLQDACLRRGLDMDGQARGGLHQRDGMRIEQHRKAARTGDAQQPGIRPVRGDRLAQGAFLGPARQPHIAQAGPGGGQREPLARLHDQRLAQLLFQLAQMLGHARLRHVQPLRRTGEMPLLGQDGKGLDPGGVQHRR